MADSVVTIGADLGELRRELARLPNLSGEAAQKTLIKVEKAVKSAERAAKTGTKALTKANKAAAAASVKASKEMQAGLKGVIELGGISGDKIDKLGHVWTALSNPVVVAAVAFASAGAALVGMGAGMIAAVGAAETLNEELDYLKEIEGFEGIDPEALASIKAANSGVDALGVIAKKALIILGTEFAPAVERASFVLVKLGLIALDGWEAFSSGRGVLDSLATYMAKELVQAFLAPIDGIVKLISLMGKLAGAVGADGLAADLASVNQAWEDWTGSVASSAVDYYFDKTADAIDGLNTETANYDDRARALIDTITAKRDATDAGTESTKAATEAEQELTEAVYDTTQAYKDQAETIDFFARAREKQFAKEAKEAEMVAAAYFSASSDIAAAAQSAFNTLSNEFAEQNRAMALVAFGISKAAAVAQVAIDTASAVSKINAAWAWNPVVQGPLTAAAIATGIAQGAVIASERPTFHTGGMIAGHHAAPDEVDIRAQAGESVLNKRATARLGEDGVNALNRGGGGGGGIVVVHQYKHRVLDAVMQDHLKLPTSTLRKAIAGKTRVGQK